MWNDYLVALIFIGSQPGVQVLTMRLAEIVGSRGNDWIWVDDTVTANAVIHGGDGNDHIHGGGGNDTVIATVERRRARYEVIVAGAGRRAGGID